eukprot:928-Pelagomonas_calceolata.AAC.1
MCLDRPSHGVPAHPWSVVPLHTAHRFGLKGGIRKRVSFMLNGEGKPRAMGAGRSRLEKSAKECVLQSNCVLTCEHVRVQSHMVHHMKPPVQCQQIQTAYWCSALSALCQYRITEAHTCAQYRHGTHLCKCMKGN